jgi:hypothetical protein
MGHEFRHSGQMFRLLFERSTDAHGGPIHIASAAGAGATMTARLPVFTRESAGNFDRRTVLTASGI